MLIRSLRNRKNEHKAKKSKNKPDVSTVNEIAHFTSSYTPRHIRPFVHQRKERGLKKKKKKKPEHTREVSCFLFLLPCFLLQVLFVCYRNRITLAR